jgi:hypothetical protein
MYSKQSISVNSTVDVQTVLLAMKKIQPEKEKFVIHKDNEGPIPGSARAVML